ncbi:MAG: hypothetical protein ACMG55_09930 [Microcoleus sp.]
MFTNNSPINTFLVTFGGSDQVIEGSFSLLLGQAIVAHSDQVDLFYTILGDTVVARSHIVVPDCTPAAPTVTATASNTGVVTAKVTNTADKGGATVVYTTTACNGTVKTTTVVDGQSGTITFTGVPAGSCAITVTGDDGTTAQTTVVVPPKPVDCSSTNAGATGSVVVAEGSVVYTVTLPKVACQDMSFNGDTYSVPSTYDGSGNFNASAVPQDFTPASRATLVIKVGQSSATVTKPMPTTCGWVQTDVYDGAKINHVTITGHGSQFIAGGLVKVGNACPVAQPAQPTVTASASCPNAGKVVFTNPGEQRATVMYGSFAIGEPDGSVDVPAHGTAKITTARKSLDWFAYVADSGIEDGMGRGLVVPQSCGTKNPPPHKPPPTTPPAVKPVSPHNQVPLAKTDWAGHQEQQGTTPALPIGFVLLALTLGAGFGVRRKLRPQRGRH